MENILLILHRLETHSLFTVTCPRMEVLSLVLMLSLVIILILQIVPSTLHAKAVKPITKAVVQNFFSTQETKTVIIRITSCATMVELKNDGYKTVAKTGITLVIHNALRALVAKSAILAGS